MSRFRIDFHQLRSNLLLRHLRRPATLAYLGAVSAPLARLYNSLGSAFAEADYELSHNSQVARMEALLNDAFDGDERRIYIADAPEVLPLWIYRRPELKPAYIYRRSEAKPAFVHRRDEIEANTSFIVWVPAAVVFDAARMRALVNKYRLPSSAFTIKTF